MVERRNILGGGLLAGLTGVLASPAESAATPAAAAEDTSAAAAAAVDRLRATVERGITPVSPGTTIAAIRQQQRTFIRANQKYPDFIEVGLGVWEDVYDWHVRHQQPIMAGRLADGRYTIAFMFTTLILRPEQSLDYVGYPYDPEPVRR